MVQTLPTSEAALAAAIANLATLNKICEAAGLPPLTAEKAVNCYWEPRGSSQSDFFPAAPDGGANNAGAFGDLHFSMWELTVLVSTGKTAEECGYVAAQNAAAAQWVEMAPVIAETAAALNAMRCPPED